MKKWLPVFIFIPCVLILGWHEYRSRQFSTPHAPVSFIAQLSNEPITPIPITLDLDSRKVALGEQLFSETRLSHNNTISCSTCHSLSKGGTDRLTHSIGIDGQSGPINAPTVFNSRLNFVQFWDGRSNTLEQQVDGPIHDPVEMASNWPEVVQKLGESPSYQSSFHAVYDDGIQATNIKDALATFERSLITPNSRFDRYLRGESNAITPAELEGYRFFKEYGCASCHQGTNAGGNLFQKFGVMGDYFRVRGNITKADFGRYNVTNDEADRYVFKVPSLRNVAITAPYFHDGSARGLEDAVTIMSIYQLGHPLTPAETAAIVKFLETLTGEYQGKAL